MNECEAFLGPGAVSILAADLYLLEGPIPISFSSVFFFLLSAPLLLLTTRSFFSKEVVSLKVIILQTIKETEGT